MKTGDPELMREINRFRILDIVRRFGPIARVEIAERAELSSTTVSAITGGLIEDAIIQPVSLGGIHEPSRGRPRVMLQLNPDAARVVGVRIGPHGIAAAVTNFAGEILSSLHLALRVHRQSVPVVADLVEDTVRRAVVEAGLTLADVRSLCVTLPGTVEFATGLVRQGPVFSDRDVLFGKAVAARLAVPVVVESDANALALAEHWFGECRDVEDFALLLLEQAIGLAVLHDGQLFRGANGLSHDIGALVIGTAEGTGAPVRLAELACESAVLHQFGAHPGAHDFVHAGLGFGAILERMRPDVGDLTPALESAGHAIGVAAANVAILFAPPRIVLSGSLLALGAPLHKRIAASFRQAVGEPLRDVTALVIGEPAGPARLGQGAAAIALRELYGSPFGTTGPASRH